MTSRLASLLLLVVAACGSDPPKSADAPTHEDKTEVKMEVVPIADAAAPEPVATAPSTIAQPASTDPADDPNIGGTQSDDAVEKAVAPIRPRIRACYKKATAKQSGVAGTVTFDTVIAKDGKVTSVRFVKKTGLGQDMVECLSTAAKTMQLPSDRKSQVVVFTFGAPPGADAGAGVDATKH